jgi:hypothetical protein
VNREMRIIGRKPQSIWVGQYRREAEFFRKRAAEFRRLAGLTQDAYAQKILTQQVRVAEHVARRRDDAAIEAEYGHLYVEEGGCG